MAQGHCGGRACEKGYIVNMAAWGGQTNKRKVKLNGSCNRENKHKTWHQAKIVKKLTIRNHSRPVFEVVGETGLRGHAKIPHKRDP